VSSVDPVGVRGRVALRAGVLLGIAISTLIVTSLDASTALATTTTFNTQGCQTWSVPTGVSSVSIQATGSAGETINNGTAPGGNGDVVSGTLSGLSEGQSLDVCVKLGGGAGGGWGMIDAHGGYGGGASGVALGNQLWPDFSNPVPIAAGGGGGALNGQIGGSAGLPSGGAGADDSLTVGSGGGGGTQTAGGAAGRSGCSGCGAGGAGGAPFPLTCGGQGGYSSFVNVGGGGGGGYYGGGGGGADLNEAGGGGGGSDFCASTLTTPASLGTTCGVTGTNSTFGTASAVLTYTASADL
jgi:hypothetical protein